MQLKRSFRTPQDQGVLCAWQEQIANAARNPNLEQQLLQREHELLPRFTEHYHKLTALPRRVRRGLQRKWKQSLAAMALLLVLGQAPALAATINVGGGCNLIAAIRAANTDTRRDGCLTGKGRDTIVLPPGSTQRLMSVNNSRFGATGLPAIRSEITISGRGSAIRRASGATDDFRILAVTSAGHLTLRRTTVSGGNTRDNQDGGGYGGGVFNEGTLTLTNSILSSNFADQDGGGVFNEGTVTLINSTLSDNRSNDGGGMSNRSGTLTLTNSAISDNSSNDDGGGLHVLAGTVTLTNSTVSGNTATFTGGGGVSNDNGTLTVTNSTISRNTSEDIYSDGGGVSNFGTLIVTRSTISGNTSNGGGGGISNDSGTTTLTNSTVSGNSAKFGGGVISVSSFNSNNTLTLTNSTISSNSAVGGGREDDACGGEACGGGIYNGRNNGTVTLDGTLVSGNIASRGREIFNGNNATIAAANFNLFGHNGNAGVRGFSRGPTDIVPRKVLGAILNTDLADNGGPTQTHALVRGSPASDRVTDGTCPPPSRDQRGVKRPQDGNGDGAAICDIGSFERRPRE